ncbi:MAG: glycosyltransferase family 4 protein [Nocardioides sp.]|uniref:glycosyltransferase family 4 protein n=1 Tax=Nocardioides sp. TaxID=35761 RepID=UPI003F113947
MVTESFLPQVNGVTNSVLRVLEHLRAHGHTAAVLAPTGPDVVVGARVVRTRGASLPGYPEFRVGWECRRRLRAVMREFRPDVVHLASPAILGARAADVAEELGVPVVAVYQTDLVGFAQRYPVPGGAQAMADLTRRVHTRVERTLAPSTASMQQLSALGVPRVHHWPRGVDATLFHPARRSPRLRSRLAPEGELLVGYVGRLAAEKELELLTHVHDLPGTRLVVVGGGPQERALRTLLPRAVFTGVLHGPDLGRAYACLDVFVHTGRHETFCQSVQEALASGVPVVAPRSGGPLDLVTPGVDGLLFEPGDGPGLAAAVTSLAHDSDTLDALSAAARAGVAGRTWESVNGAQVDHYRDVVGARPRSHPGQRVLAARSRS